MTPPRWGAVGRAPRFRAGLVVVVVAAFVFGCDRGQQDLPESDRPSSPARSDASPSPTRCTIPCEQVDFETRRPGVAPPLRRPTVAAVDEAVDLLPDDEVVGVVVGDEARAYPLRVLARHEQLEDRLGGRALLVVHAPYAGATTVIDRDASRLAGPLDDTGGLLNGEPILTDRATGSWWSPLRREAIRGPRIGDELRVVPLLQTTLEVWRALYPASTVVTTDTGHADIEYDGDPYAWYAADDRRLLSPVRFLDLRLPHKERVLGLCQGGECLAVRVGPAPRVVARRLGGRALLVVTDGRHAAAFTSHAEATFELLEARSPAAFFRDRQTASVWSFDGRCTSGPRRGERLERLAGQPAFFFAWAALHPGTAIE